MTLAYAKALLASAPSVLPDELWTSALESLERASEALERHEAPGEVPSVKPDVGHGP